MVPSLTSLELNLLKLSIDVVKNRFLDLLCYGRFQICIWCSCRRYSAWASRSGSRCLFYLGKAWALMFQEPSGLSDQTLICYKLWELVFYVDLTCWRLGLASEKSRSVSQHFDHLLLKGAGLRVLPGTLLDIIIWHAPMESPRSLWESPMQLQPPDLHHSLQPLPCWRPWVTYGWMTNQ